MSNRANLKWSLFPKIKVVYGKNAIFVAKSEIEGCLDSKNQSRNQLIDALKTKINADKNTYLALKSSNFSIPLNFALNYIDSKDILLEHLIHFTTKFQKNLEEPDTWLEFVEKSDEHQKELFLSIPICDQNGSFLIFFPFTNSIRLSISLIVQQISSLLNLESNKISLCDAITGIFQPSFKQIIYSLINKRLFIMTEISDKIRSNINERCNAYIELQQTEKTFVEYMNTIQFKIIPFFEENNIIKDINLFAQFTICINTILICNTELCETLNEYTNPFTAPIGKILLKFLKVNQEPYNLYSDYQKTVNTAIIAFKNNKNNNKILENFVSDPIFKNQPLESLIIKPIQRIPQYKIILERILKNTPYGHPDHAYIAAAIEQLIYSQRRENEKAYIPTNTQQYLQIIGNLNDKIPVEENQRYVNKFNINIISINSQKEEALIVLYSNKFIIFNYKSKIVETFEYAETRIIREPTSNAPIESSKSTFPSSNEEEIKCTLLGTLQTSIIFKTENDYSEFLKIFEDTSFVAQDKRTSQEPGLKWKKESECKLKLFHHSMAGSDNIIYIFGGVDDCGYLSDAFITYDINTKQWNIDNVSKDRPKARQDAVLIYYDECLYLYGGFDEKGSLNDFWKYDIEKSKWKELYKNVSISSGGYFSADIIQIGSTDEILFVGGTNKVQTLLYKIQENLWEEICVKSKILPIMKFQKIAFYDEKSVVLFGGITPENELIKDVYILNIKTKEWSKNDKNIIGQFPYPRYGHSLIFFKSHLWTFGGIGNSIPYMMSPTKQFVMIRNEGDCPLFLSFSSCCIAGDRIWIFGGMSEADVVHTLYSIELIRDEILSSDIIVSLLSSKFS